MVVSPEQKFFQLADQNTDPLIDIQTHWLASLAGGLNHTTMILDLYNNKTGSIEFGASLKDNLAFTGDKIDGEVTLNCANFFTINYTNNEWRIDNVSFTINGTKMSEGANSSFLLGEPISISKSRSSMPNFKLTKKKRANRLKSSWCFGRQRPSLPLLPWDTHSTMPPTRLYELLDI